MSKRDTDQLSNVVKNVHNAVSNGTPLIGDSEDLIRSARIIATGQIVAALIQKDETIYYDFD